MTGKAAEMLEAAGATALVVFIVGPMLLALGATLYDYVVAPALISAAEVDRLAFATLAAPESNREILSRRLAEAYDSSNGRALGQWRRVARMLRRMVD